MINNNLESVSNISSNLVNQSTNKDIKDEHSNFADLINVMMESDTNLTQTPSMEALANFYEIHQRSQITGVPTNEYNNAVKALGIDISEPFFQNKAIELLNNYNFNTNFPTKEAVLKYGNTQQDHGNRAYMIGNGKFETGEMYSKAVDNSYDEFVAQIRDEEQINSQINLTSNQDDISNQKFESINNNEDNSIINSITPQPIILDDENDNSKIDTEKLVSTLELLLLNPNVVNNDVKQSVENTLDFLINLNNQNNDAENKE